MTRDEAQGLLDEMLYPFKKEKKCTDANKTLSSAEMDLLLQIVIDFENLSEKFDYENALEQIAKILGRYVKQATTKTDKGMNIALHPDTVPFLIKQVL
ncbi:MAG: hypothetical protein NC548_60880, partial [Lachnospiraceae bacterium]|nr:hypothetical protein [Lachnospiraceae bacterium]